MTNPAEINTARLTQQLEINRLGPTIDELEKETGNGKSWDQIEGDWNSAKSRLDTTRSTLQNLKGQNSGFKNSAGYTRTETKLTQNIVETTTLNGRLVEVQRTSFSNQNTINVKNNLAKDSSADIVLNEQVGAIETARFTSPITNRQFFDEVKKEPEPIIASLNKPSNARIASTSTAENQQLGDVKGSGATSTVGGNVPVKKQAVAAGTDDDATQLARNSVGNSSQVVDGRTVIANEFLETITPSPNKLAGLASQTYSVSIYLMNKSEFIQFLGTDRKQLPTDQLILQSGGAPFGKRNKYFDLDFYVENLLINSQISGQATQAPHNVTNMSFEIMEPQGITFLPRLIQACGEHEKESEDTNVNSQNFLMVIRFYGYDEFGNLVSNAGADGAETTSDPNALVEKFIPFQFAEITYKVNTAAVVYSVKATIPQVSVGYSSARGTIPFNFQLSASSVLGLLNGDSALVPLKPLTTSSTSRQGGPPNQNLEVTSTKTTSVAAQRANKIGLEDRTVTAGLCTALNEHQNELAKKTPGMIPDVYIIELEDVAGLIDAKMKKQGTTNIARAPFIKSDSPNEQLNQKKQALDTSTKEYSISAGTQITQLIDQVMKNSTYITSQQTVAFDEKTGKKIDNAPVKTVQWYKITQTCKPIAYDKVRNDYAYEIKYRVNRYQINTPRSPYFPPAMYRGVHKVFNYWFTGENTEVMDFEIQSNSNYLTIIGKDGLVDESPSVLGDARVAEKRFFSNAAGTSTQGGEGESTRPAAQLADRLYDPADIQNSGLTIVGDPDFITQSELFYTNEINLSPFEPDGSVNTSASEVLYELRFNRVTDYDMATGLTPVYKNNLEQSKITGEQNLAQESIVFTAIEVDSKFQNGMFTQDVKGTLRNFDTALDSPQQIKAKKNEVAKEAPSNSQNKKIETPTARPSKKPVPVGSRGNGKYLDTRNQQSRNNNTGGDATPTNRPPDYISSGARPSGLKSVTPTKPKSPYSSPTVNNQTTGRIARGLDQSVNYTDTIVDSGNWQPPVQNKPGATVQSDDAGTVSSTSMPFRESLLAKKNRLAAERSKRRVAAGAKVVSSSGGGVRASDAFR